MDMRTMSDKSLHSTYSGNIRPSLYTFHNNFRTCRTSPLSTTSEATHINYANELTNWRQMDPNQSVMPFPGNSMSPGYYGQYGYSEPYSTNMRKLFKKFDISILIFVLIFSIPKFKFWLPHNERKSNDGTGKSIVCRK